jgi:hypothetical protein
LKAVTAKKLATLASVAADIVSAEAPQGGARETDREREREREREEPTRNCGLSNMSSYASTSSW